MVNNNNNNNNNNRILIIVIDDNKMFGKLLQLIVRLIMNLVFHIPEDGSEIVLIVSIG